MAIFRVKWVIMRVFECRTYGSARKQLTVHKGSFFAGGSPAHATRKSCEWEFQSAYELTSARDIHLSVFVGLGIKKLLCQICTYLSGGWWDQVPSCCLCNYRSPFRTPARRVTHQVSNMVATFTPRRVTTLSCAWQERSGKGNSGTGNVLNSSLNVNTKYQCM